MIGDFLHRVTTALETNEVPYMLTGSLASSMYGIPRATNDIDIVIAPTRLQLQGLVALLQRAGLTVAEEEALAALANRTQFPVVDLHQGWKADFILRKDRGFSRIEFDRRASLEVEGLRLTIATPEDVLLAKLEWSKMGGSERQLLDAAGILEIQSNRLDRAYIEEWVDSLGLHEQWTAASRMAHSSE